MLHSGELREGGALLTCGGFLSRFSSRTEAGRAVHRWSTWSLSDVHILSPWISSR